MNQKGLSEGEGSTRAAGVRGAALFGKCFFRTAIGFVALFIALVFSLSCGFIPGSLRLFPGPDALGEAVGMVLAAVICTGGLGLIVIIPASYVAGLLLTIWWVPLAGVKPPPHGSLKSGTSPSYLQGIVRYIHQARAKGHSDGWIRKECKRNGATEEDLAAAFAMEAHARPT